MTHDAVSEASELMAAAFLDFQIAGSRTLDLYRVCQIADRLDVSVDWLVGRSDVMELQKDEKRKRT